MHSKVQNNPHIAKLYGEFFSKTPHVLSLCQQELTQLPTYPLMTGRFFKVKSEEFVTAVVIERL